MIQRRPYSPPAGVENLPRPAVGQEVTAKSDVDFFRWLFEAHRSFTEHAEFMLDHSPATLQSYRDAFANFRKFLEAEPASGRSVSGALTQIERWVRWNRERKLSRVSTNTYFRMLRPFFRFLHREHGIPDAFAGLRPPGPGEADPKARSADDCRRILAAAAGHAWPSTYQRARAVSIMSLFIYGGLRRNEVVHLTIADINLEERTVHLRNTKGRNGGSFRTVYMHDRLRIALAEYLRAREDAGIELLELFVSLRTGKGLTPAGVREVARVVRRVSGVNFSLHSLRHAHVVLLLQGGAQLHVVRELVGHRQLATTARYIRVWDEEKRAQIQRLKL